MSGVVPHISRTVLLIDFKLTRHHRLTYCSKYFESQYSCYYIIYVMLYTYAFPTGIALVDDKQNVNLAGKYYLTLNKK